MTPLKLTIRFLVTVLMVYGLQENLSQYFTVFGGWPAYIVIGALLTLMNLLVRPVLNLVSLPAKLFAYLLTLVIVNALFLWIVYRITLLMDPNLIVLVVTGGITGWITVSLIMGFVNWVMKMVLK